MMAALNVAEGARHAGVLSVGAYRPSRVIPNSEVVEAIDRRVGAAIAVTCYVDHDPPPPPVPRCSCDPRNCSCIRTRDRRPGR